MSFLDALKFANYLHLNGQKIVQGETVQQFFILVLLCHDSPAGLKNGIALHRQ